MQRELTFTEARRALVGDVNLLRRIYRFLSAWQLINYLARRRPALPDGAGGKGARGVESNRAAGLCPLQGGWGPVTACLRSTGGGAMENGWLTDWLGTSLPAAAAGGLPVSGVEALYAPSRRAPVEAGATATLTGTASTAVRVRSSVYGTWARQPALATKVGCSGCGPGGVGREIAAEASRLQGEHAPSYRNSHPPLGVPTITPLTTSAPVR